MCLHSHGYQMMVTESSKETDFWVHFFFNNLIHQYDVSLLASFFMGMKEMMQGNNHHYDPFLL